LVPQGRDPILSLRTAFWSTPFSAVYLLTRFAAISRIMKQLQTSTFLDCMQPYKDKEVEFFNLLAKIPVSWLPHWQSWELSNSSYSDSNCKILSESVVSCPICITISPLGLFYECTHECCMRCNSHNKEKVCSRCGQPERKLTRLLTREDEVRIIQFNQVYLELSYRCPCGVGKCKPKKLFELEKATCPIRFVCPLLGMQDCKFRGSRNAVLKHLRKFHSMEGLWKEYREGTTEAGIHEADPSVWRNEEQLLRLLLV
jgi:ribosomal protein L37E